MVNVSEIKDSNNEYNVILALLQTELDDDTLSPVTFYNNVKNSVGSAYSLATIFAISEELVNKIKNCSISNATR